MYKRQTIYIGVMALEFAPALFERLGWKVSLQRLNKVMFFIIALGALLPTMHQSSMGSLMILSLIHIYRNRTLTLKKAATSLRALLVCSAVWLGWLPVSA